MVEVMDALRSPGGCPWDAEQTHASLAPYAVEEAFELAEAIENGDRSHVREELGDLLLQVVFHARIAQEDAAEPYDLDDVAHGIAAKMRRRHPHVFGDGEASTPAEVEARWDELKAAEKPDRSSLFDAVSYTHLDVYKRQAHRPHPHRRAGGRRTALRLAARPVRRHGVPQPPPCCLLYTSRCV